MRESVQTTLGRKRPKLDGSWKQLGEAERRYDSLTVGRACEKLSDIKTCTRMSAR